MKNGSALDGLKVLDLGRVLSAPFCAATLADMGAEVIKVEVPGQGDIARNMYPKKDQISTYYVAFNRGKKGITLNLKTEKGKKILRRLIGRADVLVENFRPGVMERLGFSYREASAINPRLIYASISGYGQTGTYAHRAAYDPVAQAASGLMSVTGEKGGQMVRCGASIADILAGQNAVIAILAALEHRRTTGRGQQIDISLIDSCIVALSSINQIYFTTGKIPEPRGNSFEGSAPGDSYPTADGRVVILSGQDWEWKKLCRVLGHDEWLSLEEYATPAARVANREALDGMITGATSGFETQALIDKLNEVGIPASAVKEIDQVVNDPHYRDTRQMFADVRHPVLGEVRITNSCLKMSETTPYVRGCAPTLGEHNREVYEWLGLTGAEIEELRAEGVI